MSTPLIRDHLRALYGDATASAVEPRLRAILDLHRTAVSRAAPPRRDLDENDALLITYADQVLDDSRAPLQSLAEFCRAHLTQIISGVHVLPFYPSSSDDGFSVMDYRCVDPALGSWDDLAVLRHHFRLMFDAVLNHASAQGEWFQAFLRGDPRRAGYFITVDGDVDLGRVVRPRALPVLTPFDTAAGPRRVWTTFSADQIDLDYRNPEVLLEMIDILLLYVERGADLLRLDAIAYLWKEAGTTCIHLPQTHRVVNIIRAVLVEIAPWVSLITETNVPHADNVSYFGDGENEAQLVYNFALPPLLLDALLAGCAGPLTRWARSLRLPSSRVTFFNFLASHDGIGLNPARGLLEPEAIDTLVAAVQGQSGLVSLKHEPDGSSTPYELNANYLDALSDPAESGDTSGVERFLAAHAVMLSLVGLPGIYFHSLFGSRGWPEGARQTGRPRTINRERCNRAAIERELLDPGSRRHYIFGAMSKLLRARRSSPAFHPHGEQEVLEAGPSVFAHWRLAPGGNERVLCLQNLSAGPATVECEAAHALGQLYEPYDLIAARPYTLKTMRLAPHQSIWLRSGRD